MNANDGTLAIWVAMVGGGACAMFLVLLLARPLSEQPAGVAQPGTPSQQPLPWLWRLAWPWVVMLAPVCIRFVSWRVRQRLEDKRIQADLPLSCSAGHLCAASWMTASLASAGVWLVGSQLQLLTFSTLLALSGAAALIASRWPLHWLNQRARSRTAAIERALPFYLDITVLCVEGGLSLHGALVQAARHGPAGPLREELARALLDIRAGEGRTQALGAMARRADSPALRAWVGALAQAESLGLPLGNTLRAQAEQRRADQYQRAERLAQEAPVKMLLPLAVCIFPCTFLMIGFPLAVSMLGLA